MLPRLLSPPVAALLLSSSLMLLGASEPDGVLRTPVERDRLFISAAELLAADADTLTLLDARSASAYNRGHLPRAMHVSWLDHRDGWGRTGRLTKDLGALATQLAALGVRNDRRVIVYGDADEGWGEEGRIAWTLRYLGHDRVSVLDGGIAAWVQAEGEITRASPRPQTGDFVFRLDSTLRAMADDVASGRESGVVILDTRSADEWNGSRRYFPARTGRIPGAVHLEWKELLDEDGLLDKSSAAYARLRAKGLTTDRPVIAYCVGGVRSAFVTMALRELGFRDIRNYDGSWYEWSADRTRAVERPSPASQ